MKFKIGDVVLGDTGQWATIVGLKHHCKIHGMIDLKQAETIVKNQVSTDNLQLLLSALVADGILKKPANEYPHTAYALQFMKEDLKLAMGEEAE